MVGVTCRCRIVHVPACCLSSPCFSGIELVRLNFETPKILDQGIAKQMAEQALSVAAVSSQEAVMKQQADIARVRADQAATVVRIAQEQENANKLSIARTAKEAAQLEADALLIKAEAAHSVQKMEGRQFDDHPALLQIKLAQIQSAAISNAKISMVIAPEKVGNALAMFGNMPHLMQIAGMTNQQPAEEEKQPVQQQQQANGRSRG